MKKDKNTNLPRQTTHSSLLWKKNPFIFAMIMLKPNASYKMGMAR